MRKSWLTVCLLLGAMAASSAPAKPDPDAGKVSGSTFESTYFNFHYNFPQGWSAINDDARMTENRKRHEAQVEKKKKEIPPDTGNSKTTFQVFWLYDLLTATPAPLATGESAGLPHISIWARERFSMLNEAGDNAKLLSSLPGVKVLRKAETVTISGHEFVRADFVHPHDNYEALFVTVIGNYQLGFEFRGRNESEMNELAASIRDLQFSSKH